MKNKNSVRAMTLEDLDDIMVLETLCFKVPWSKEAFYGELNNNKLARYVVIEREGIIVGYGGVWYVMDEGHITNVAIHPDYRKLGLGRCLVEAMMSNARKEAINHMTLEVRASNTAAIGLYEKMAFQHAGIRPKYYTDNNEDAMIMWATLV